jgi:hypothetical protein
VSGGLIQILDHDVLEGFALSDARLHDGLDLLGEDATPPMGFRLGQDRVHDRLLVVAQQSDETLVRLACGVDAKVAEEDPERDAALSGERDGLSAGHMSPTAPAGRALPAAIATRYDRSHKSEP